MEISQIRPKSFAEKLMLSLFHGLRGLVAIVFLAIVSHRDAQASAGRSCGGSLETARSTGQALHLMAPWRRLPADLSAFLCSETREQGVSLKLCSWFASVVQETRPKEIYGVRVTGLFPFNVLGSQEVLSNQGQPLSLTLAPCLCSNLEVKLSCPTVHASS